MSEISTAAAQYSARSNRSSRSNCNNPHVMRNRKKNNIKVESVPYHRPSSQPPAITSIITSITTPVVATPTTKPQ
ncbi:hypothetical protein Glove_283g140 [Diversispora epigaea]|uniref:Uncharacterized protein n=1 Tax=Diversispora epigaea TaxID=1348612 RepID=A0A397I1S8_9GLOM|nr:hypothetical protein Glove_283g140 [Diversispora epigaea]